MSLAASHRIDRKHSGFFERRVLRALSGLPYGTLKLDYPDGGVRSYGAPARGLPNAVITIHDPGIFRRFVLGGELAMAEAYLDGAWSSPDLAAVVALGAINAEHYIGRHTGSFMTQLWARLQHFLRDNNRRGSQRNIRYHYDLGNDFYRQWLDPSMTYSSACFGRAAGGSLSLLDAQLAKYDRIIELAEIGRNARVLEIGCGWGGFAERVAQHGARVHGITLSHEQLAYCRARRQGAENDTRMTFTLTDYRDVAGQYDHIVSIEMIEAVGCRHWPVYFRKIRDCLKPGGTAVLQAITIAGDRFDVYRKSVDYIQQYIFPGGMLLSPQAIEQQVRRAGLRLDLSESFGFDYARTLKIWNENFQSAWPAIKRQGFDTRFKRMWEYYLCYCRAGFETGSIDVGHFRLTRPA